METVELAYDVHESGADPDRSPIILLHGLFWNKFMMRDLAEALCHETKRKVFALDLRCHDQSPSCEKWNAELMAEDIKRFIKDRDLQKVVFVCHSFSCTLAYLVLLDQPDSVEKVVMVDHPPFADYTDEFYNDNVYPQFVSQERFLSTLDKSMSLSAAKRKILSLCCTGNVTEAQRIFLHKVAYELTKVNNQFKWKTDHKTLIEEYRENCRPAPRGRSDHEILIIRCKGSSRVTDDKFEAVLKYNPNARLVTVHSATHLLMFDQQEEFLEAVKDFLS